MERFADQPPSASPLPWTVPTGAENAFIYLTVSAGPSDFLFSGADCKYLLYLQFRRALKRIYLTVSAGPIVTFCF